MNSRLLKHAEHRLDFPAHDSRENRLVATRRFLELEGRMIQMRHAAGTSGLEIAEARSQMVDLLLARLFDFAIQAHPETFHRQKVAVALLALGGYGRQELSPLSDIDFMFLLPSRLRAPQLKSIQSVLTDEILYILWDTGLKIGYSFRTLEEAFQEARSDMLTKTALLESRLVAGSDSLFATFQLAYENYYRKENPKEYLEARLEDQRSRREKLGNTVFLQEPDIKNGVGGLRDFHNILWMSRVKTGTRNLDDLVHQHYLRKNELAELKKSYDFLLSVRNELHYHQKRPNNILTLDLQPKVAHRFGFDGADPLLAVERFMRMYYQHAHTVHRISRLVERRMALKITVESKDRISFREVLRARRSDRSQRLDGFILRSGELAFERSTVFEEDPVRLIRVFRHCQQLKAELDPNLETLIRDSLKLFNAKLIRSPEAALSFRSILQTAGEVHRILELMHELGVLGRYLPEFGKLHCLVQHEFYHRYTADIHTLNTIRELDRVFTSQDPVYEPYRETLRETDHPTLLYLILLLHDLGKGLGITDHAETGVQLARQIMSRLEIPAPMRELTEFVIKKHLVMARFWQRYDLDDPHSAQTFAGETQTLEKLRFLYIHTFCDARGTADSLWNNYKDSLHHHLFRVTEDYLNEKQQASHSEEELVRMTVEQLIQKEIPGVSREEIEAHVNLLPERYFIHTRPNEIARHLQMVNRLLHNISSTDSLGSLRPVVDWRNDLNRSFTIVNIVTWDRAGLFYKLAGAFSVAGLNILSCKLICRSDHIAIDTFYVVEPGRGVVQSQSARDEFQKNVEQALVANKDLYPQILSQARRIQSSLLRNRSESQLRTSFPASVDVYHELSLRRTIIEIQCADQIGLLFRLSRAIYERGFDITFARINTERGVAIDTFYIESIPNEVEDDNERLVLLREDLMQIVSPAEAKVMHY